MFRNLLLLALLLLVSAQDEPPTEASVTDEDMGPAAFMWPPDRVWSGDMDNKGPCGSRASAGNRTEFPLTGGAVALVGQDDYYSSKISISYSNGKCPNLPESLSTITNEIIHLDPTSNGDFETLIQEKSIADLNPGHSCVEVPDAPSKVSAGDNATLQIIYRADWDAPHNQTFYACADITFVEKSKFKFEIPCFNATEPGDDDKKAGATADPNPTATHKSTSTRSSEDPKSDDDTSGDSRKLSGGAIAGIVIGAVAGLVLILGAGLFFWRRKQQTKRNSRIARMEDNARKHQLATDGAS
ncbi:glucoamylase III (alpha-1,4-glucan-glucosidase) [Fusarium heterosporum]|uniref:Glucoamylase III (Alpha-1,4-glucan-glucosidase) n=1 Tax=Fusarium heterosporum TaxID=42747 RepID=A0A8H5TWS1_FUSHE|nr:glucoamylase III (alpha-1,4-glucan-glucosidase) [Fusarium heterosporum]